MMTARSHHSLSITLDEFFHGFSESRQLFDALHTSMESVGHYELRITKSQIAFRHHKSYAWAWIPAKYQRGKTAPLVLSVSLPTRDPSPRWKEIVEPYPSRFMHHLEIYTIEEIDAQVITWLKEAWIFTER